MSIVAATLAFLAAAPVPATPAEKDFFPLAKGTKWEYTVTVMGKEIEVSQEVTKVAKEKDKPAQATIIATVEKAPQAEVLSNGPGGVYRHSYNGVELDTPVTAIKLPAKAGDTWKGKYKVGQIEVAIESETLEAETVKVAAGEYKAHPVKSAITVMDQEINTTIWYAEGVGVVKQIMILNGNEVVQELKTFTPAK